MKESACLDPQLRGGAVHVVWVKGFLETEVNCEKRLYEVLLCTRDVHQSEKYVRDVLLSYQNTFGSLHRVYVFEKLIFNFIC